MQDKNLEKAIKKEATKITLKSFIVDYVEVINAICKVLQEQGKTFDDIEGDVIDLGNHYYLNSDGIIDNHVERSACRGNYYFNDNGGIDKYIKKFNLVKHADNTTSPSTVDGADTSFDMTVNYQSTDMSLYCQETVTEGTDKTPHVVMTYGQQVYYNPVC